MLFGAGQTMLGMKLSTVAMLMLVLLIMVMESTVVMMPPNSDCNFERLNC